MMLCKIDIGLSTGTKVETSGSNDFLKKIWMACASSDAREQSNKIRLGIDVGRPIQKTETSSHLWQCGIEPGMCSTRKLIF